MKRALALLFLAAGATFPALAQQPGREEDPIGRYLYPPELIMSHQQEIVLQEKQRAAIKSELQKAQSKFFDFQWQMKEEGERMTQLLQATPVDEAKVLEQADKIMSLEREVKKTHLSLLIRIKNTLTREQQAKLAEIQKSSGK